MPTIGHGIVLRVAISLFSKPVFGLEKEFPQVRNLKKRGAPLPSHASASTSR